MQSEVPHLQKFMEKHFWIIGEDYNLLTAAEPDFEDALRALLATVNPSLAPEPLTHPSKEREMDIFMIRRDMRHDRFRCVILELKHPAIKPGMKYFQQLYDYMSVIRSSKQFNAENIEWVYILIGTDWANDDYIPRQIENSRLHGVPFLAFRNGKPNAQHSIFTMRWSEIITEFELRFNYLGEKLKAQRLLLGTSGKTADEIIANLGKTSAAN